MMYFVTVPFASTVNFAIVKHINHQDLYIKLLKLHIMKVSDLCFVFLFNISRAYSHHSIHSTCISFSAILTIVSFIILIFRTPCSECF